MNGLNPRTKTMLYFILILMICSCSASNTRTTVSIVGNQFFIDGELTYKDRYWEGNKVEGLLMNSRMVQGIFDDMNKNTAEKWKYPDTKVWDADRNTDEFVLAMEDWYNHGLLSFTINLQGGSPMGYVNQGWYNSAYDEKTCSDKMVKEITDFS